MTLTHPGICDGPIRLADCRDFDRSYPWAEIKSGAIRLDIIHEQGWYFCQVANHSQQRLPFVAIDLPAMTLPGPVDLGRVPSHFATIIKDGGGCMYHSDGQPLPIWVVRGGGCDVSVQVNGYGDATLVNARYGATAPLRLCIWMWAPVEPGAMELFNFRVCIGAGVTDLFEHDGRNTPRDARPDAGPVAVVFSQHDANAGWKPGMATFWEGNSAKLRDQISRCRDLGCSRFILWMPTGWQTTLLDPNFCPSYIAAELSHFAVLAAPMRLGIGCRAGAIADPSAPGGVRSRTAAELPDAIRSLARAVGAGVGTFWRDESGFHPLDREFNRIAWDLATAAGLDPLLIAERPTWGDLDICAAYSQVQPRGGDWYYGPSNPGLAGFATAYNRRDDMALISRAGHGPWYGKLHNAAGRVREGFEEIIRNGGIPFIPAADAAEQVPWFRELQAKYQR